MQKAPAPTLIIGIGNPSRGDDALGPLAIERLEALALPGVELLTDFQLQVEYALDLAGRQRVIFIDATVSGPEPFDFVPVTAAEDASYSSHALTPAAVLHACRKLSDEAPAAEVLAIRGYGFELGEGLSPRAVANLHEAMAFLEATLGAGPAWPGPDPQPETPSTVYPSPVGEGGEAG
ncbi:MAG TPA: hydrogenase maturation protease [Thiobacillaceae bacterium]|nr:hydrogenase maturation protease [Thiobacillaceae bacterium]